MSADAPDLPDSVERRLLELLVLLSAQTPGWSGSLAQSVMRTARWQHAVRAVLREVGSLGGAVGDAFGLLLGLRRLPSAGAAVDA